MILTGKAKEDFIDYLWQSKFKKDDYKEYEDYINNQKESHTYADIIEWFDSVGIYITILNLDLQRRFYYKIVRTERIEGYFLHSERQEATKQAIIKANEIYNSKF